MILAQKVASALSGSTSNLKQPLIISTLLNKLITKLFNIDFQSSISFILQYILEADVWFCQLVDEVMLSDCYRRFEMNALLGRMGAVWR